MACGFLNGLVLALLPFAASAFGPVLTEWQKQAFSQVQKNAAELSKAAESKLLAFFDTADFRANLSSCCPSFADRPAEELLERLSKQFQAAEVASGFPAFQDPAKMFPDSAGMSIAFGMNDSFFLNDWQAVLMHSTDPESVWHGLEATYRAYRVNSSRGVVSVETWPGGCSGNKTPPEDFLLSQCYEMQSMHFTMIYRYDYEEGVLNASMWPGDPHDKTSKFQTALKLEAAPKKAKCPTGAPLSVETLVPDGNCRTFASQNNSEQFSEQDHAETWEYGLKPFQSVGAPSTLAEASERPVYAMVNLNMIDMGSPIYGDVSAVFSNKYIANSTLLSPIDSGLFEMGCHDGEQFDWTPKHNCSAVTAFKELGTLQHNKHLLWINKGFWSQLGALHTSFQRMQSPWGLHDVPGGSFLNYVEGALLGELNYPSAIRFLIGAFPALFGTEMGVRLQTWARSRGWVLIWALGPNDKASVTETSNFNFQLMTGHQSYKVNQRIIDPLVFAETTASASLLMNSTVADQFKKMWAEVASLRNQTQMTNETVAQKWREATVLFPELPIRPLMAGDCEAQLLNAECVGMTLKGTCVCYTSSEVESPEVVLV